MIHGIWFGDAAPPPIVVRCASSWKGCVDLYRDPAEVMKAAPVLGDISYWYDAIEARNWAAASDVARLALLWHRGGVYLDMDVEVVRDGALIAQQLAAFASGCAVLGEETLGGDICGAVIIAPPAHQFIAHMLMVYSATALSDTFNGRVNGTTLLTQELRNNVPRFAPIVGIAPSERYYPWHWKEKLTDGEKAERILAKQPIVAHHWLGSWVPPT